MKQKNNNNNINHMIIKLFHKNKMLIKISRMMKQINRFPLTEISIIIMIIIIIILIKIKKINMILILLQNISRINNIYIEPSSNIK
jgi:hypothetical protein